MAQLGAGFGSEYPNVIDTRQVFRNTDSPAPDSDTRIDAEFCNDALIAIVNIEEALGAGIMGSYASLAARLAALEVGGAPTPLTNVVEFVSETGVLLAGSAHQQGQQTLFYAVYDGSVPRQLVQPGSFMVYSVSYNAVTSFATPQSGVLMVAALTPQYVTAFSSTASPPYRVTIPGSTHGLTGPYFFYQAYGPGDPLPAIEVGSLSVNTTTFDVTLEFAAQQSGRLMLATGTPRYAQAFTNVSTAAPLVIPGATHGLGTANLFAQVYTPSGGSVVAIPVGALSVHHATFDVTLTFSIPESGTLILTPLPSTGPATLLAVAPEVQSLRTSFTTTRAGEDARRLAALQANLGTVLARLLILERTTTALIAQLGTTHAEESTS